MLFCVEIYVLIVLVMVPHHTELQHTRTVVTSKGFHVYQHTVSVFTSLAASFSSTLSSWSLPGCSTGGGSSSPSSSGSLHWIVEDKLQHHTITAHHHLHTITNTRSPTHHHLHTITCAPSPVHHHQRTITSTPSPAHHHQHTITSTPSPAHHH